MLFAVDPPGPRYSAQPFLTTAYHAQTKPYPTESFSDLSLHRNSTESPPPALLHRARSNGAGLGVKPAVTPLRSPALSEANIVKLSATPTPKSHISVEANVTPREPSRSLSVVSRPPTKSFHNFLRTFNLRRSAHNDSSDNIQIFDGVSTQDFEVLARVVEEWSLHGTRPKLSHHPESGLLILELPTAAHEFVLTDFRRAVQPALDRLPTNDDIYRATLETNLTVQSPRTGFSATADLALVATPMSRDSPTSLLALVESSFTQDRTQLRKKIKEELDGWPDIVLLIIIFITESQDYRSPQQGSSTWNFFAQQDHYVFPPDFITLPPTVDECNVVRASPPPVPESPASSESSNADSTHSEEPGDIEDEPEFTLEPITIAGHTWCHINNVEYHVWVKNGDTRINIDDDEGHVGELYPNILMNDVEPVIKRGLSVAKEKMAKLVRKQSSSSARKLRRSELLVDFNWKKIQKGLRVAARLTAEGRYETWYHKSFRGVKRSLDEEYEPPSGFSTPSEPLGVTTRRRRLDAVGASIS